MMKKCLTMIGTSVQDFNELSVKNIRGSSNIYCLGFSKRFNTNILVPVNRKTYPLVKDCPESSGLHFYNVRRLVLDDNEVLSFRMGDNSFNDKTIPLNSNTFLCSEDYACMLK